MRGKCFCSAAMRPSEVVVLPSFWRVAAMKTRGVEEFIERKPRSNCKHQHPSSREIPNTKLQTPRGDYLKFGAWCFSGAWSLELEILFVAPVLYLRFAFCLLPLFHSPGRCLSAPGYSFW